MASTLESCINDEDPAEDGEDSDYSEEVEEGSDLDDTEEETPLQSHPQPSQPGPATIKKAVMGAHDVLPASMKIDLNDREAVHKLFLEMTMAMKQDGIVPSDFSMAIDQAFSGRDSLQLSDAQRGMLWRMFGTAQVANRRRKS